VYCFIVCVHLVSRPYTIYFILLWHDVSCINTNQPTNLSSAPEKFCLANRHILGRGQRLYVSHLLMWFSFLSHPTNIRPVKKLGVDLLVVTIWLELCMSYLQLSPPPPSSLAPIKSKLETFWYRQTQVHLDNGR